MRDEKSDLIGTPAMAAMPTRASGDAVPAADRGMDRAWTRSAELARSPAILELRRRALTERPTRWERAGKMRLFGTAFAAAACIAMMIWAGDFSSLAVRDPAGTATFVVATGVNEQRQIRLPDGSLVRLDGRSMIRLAYDGAVRRVSLLGGRAYFDVKHDPAHPFLVDAASGEITDVGTRFTVDRSDSRVTVSLIEGSVTVREGRGETPLALLPGEQAAFAPGRGVERLAQTKKSDPLDWTRGIVTLNDVPLVQAVAVLSRYSAQPIRLDDDPDLSGRRVTGVFRARNAASFPTSLATALDLKESRTPSGSIILSSKRKGG